MAQFGILPLSREERYFVCLAQNVSENIYTPQHKDIPTDINKAIKQEIVRSGYHESMKTRLQRLLRSREYDVRRSRIHESKISAGTEFQISGLHEARISRTPEVMSS